MTAPITITLNGEPRTLAPATSLSTLIATFDQDPRGIAIERNRAIVPRSAWDATVLEDGDRLEMVMFVGGG